MSPLQNDAIVTPQKIVFDLLLGFSRAILAL